MGGMKFKGTGRNKKLTVLAACKRAMRRLGLSGDCFALTGNIR